MAHIEKFEDIIAWKKARELSKMVYNLTQNTTFSKDFSLIDQIKRSSGSAMDNIAEGFERGGNKEFIQFLYISKGSVGEVKSQLYRAFDNEYINKTKFDITYQLANELSKLISGFINYLKSSTIKGDKFK